MVIVSRCLILVGILLSPVFPANGQSLKPASVQLSPASKAKQRKLMAELRPLGVSIRPEGGFYERPGWEVRINSFEPDEIEKAVSLLEQAKPFSVLQISGDINDAQLSKLIKDHPGLYQLRLERTSQITGKGTASISALKSLQSLTFESLENLNNPSDWSFLKHVTALESLYLMRCDFSAGAAAFLKPLTNLEVLVIVDGSLTDASLSSLSGMTNLRLLGVEGMPEVTGSFLGELTKSKWLDQLSFVRTGLQNDSLRHLSQFQGLRGLVLDSTKVTEAGFVHLQNFRNLTILSLENTQLQGGEEFRHLSRLTRLSDLSFGVQPRFSGEGLHHLKSVAQLRSLDLTHAAITDQGLADLSQLSQVQALFLPAPGEEGVLEISDQGVKHLGNMTGLGALSLSGRKITDEGLKELAGLTQLTSLRLRRLPLMTGTALQSWNTLTELELLDIRKTGCTDQNLKFLLQLKKLEDLSLPAALTPAGIDQFAGHPNLKKIRFAHGVSEETMKHCRERFPKVSLSVDRE